MPRVESDNIKYLKYHIIPCYNGLVFDYRIIPESVRWMITAGKIDEASEELKCIAKHNGKKLSEESLKHLEAFKTVTDKEITIVNNNNSVGLFTVMVSGVYLRGKRPRILKPSQINPKNNNG